MAHDDSKDKKIGSVSRTGKAKGVQPTEAVETVAPVQKTQGVGAADAVAGVRRGATRVMTSAEREELFKAIHEEAEKLFGPNGLPEHQRAVVEEAVRAAVDGALLDTHDQDPGEPTPKKKSKK